MKFHQKRKELSARGERGKIILIFILLGVLFLELLMLARSSSNSSSSSSSSSNTEIPIATTTTATTATKVVKVKQEEQNLDDKDEFGELRPYPGKGPREYGENAKHAEIDDEPRLYALVGRLRTALYPFMYRFLASHDPDRVPKACDPKYSEALESKFLGGCPSDSGCLYFATLETAKQKCSKYIGCSGVTQTGPRKFELRESAVPGNSHSGETSWLKEPCLEDESNFQAKQPDPVAIWDAFSSALDKALDDPMLFLSTSYGPPREDGSIYISIASYRDPSCASTLKRAYERADRPENLFVGIVQQNCMHDCMTGTGWGNTRRWVKQNHPDPDCIEHFCKSDLGKPHCEAGRIRILRLEEADSYGPFFTRFLNSKLWRGETYYLQIDSHTNFREGWDVNIISQMQKTPTYPYSVISNYPPSGTPDSPHPWARKSNFGVPSSLCGCTFESGGGGKHHTIRLSEIPRSFGSNVDNTLPHQSCFVAAGFFIAHGSIVDKVQFDPFLPYLFMGEEIALTIRFWTNGYDIYGPIEDVLQHEYVRKEHPKFWESITMVFSSGIHNDLTDLVVQRVQHLVGFPEAKDPRDVSNPSLLLRMSKYHCGKNRSQEDFVKFMGLDLVNKQQNTPEWCIAGTNPPWAVVGKNAFSESIQKRNKLRRAESEVDRDILS